MALSSWLALEDALSPLALTVLAQALPPNDMGKLIWEDYFPRENVPTVDLANITTLDYRPTADRREWNARGRRIPMVIPSRRRVSIVPIEANDKIDEKEMQRISETYGGQSELIRQAIGVTIPQRVERLVDSVYRRLEVDCMNAWALGNITQRDPEDASKTYTASFGFSSARYLTAPTAWNDAGVNAYDLLQAFLFAAADLIGAVEGVMLRLATLNAILADAPLMANQVKMTRSQLADRISQDFGMPFAFFLNENSVDIFDDGGTAFTRTKIWPAHIVAAVPQGGVIGNAAFAPVTRAMDLASQVGESGGIDVRGVTIYYEDANGGRSLDIEAQSNSMPIPDEQKIAVIDAGV